MIVTEEIVKHYSLESHLPYAHKLMITFQWGYSRPGALNPKYTFDADSYKTLVRINEECRKLMGKTAGDILSLDDIDAHAVSNYISDVKDALSHNAICVLFACEDVSVTEALHRKVFGDEDIQHFLASIYEGDLSTDMHGNNFLLPSAWIPYPNK